ncbi:hypothetical protein BDV98DRAFT_149949 [Pterulicium gracile]|uniref:Uncharacterized protein n=1 Tax=Pterulicium gracile TaxID=1884261 RepID=A0A5C3QYI6_9AGAR|nr:hypothetical protein BDV98DRAFT_149949 [Pterula gracilis]
MNLRLRGHWDYALGAVERAIDQCKSSLETFQKTLQEDMDDSRNRSLAELFAGVGALAVCTVTPFFPGAAFVGAGLLTKTVSGLREKGKLDDALDAVRRDLDMARSLENRFKELLPLLQIDRVWESILKDLNTVSQWNRLIDHQEVLGLMRPRMLERWDNIKNTTQSLTESSKSDFLDLH